MYSNKDSKKFAKFFAKQDPEKFILDLNLVNEAMWKNIEELELAIKLARSEKVKKIYKDILKLKIDNL